ncbi:hypothetical protein KHP62_01160 [Rhodobacteraceae bacterium NNCM2]|nr:hypothetical protein [Coraliihabitans acroporae]
MTRTPMKLATFGAATLAVALTSACAPSRSGERVAEATKHNFPATRISKEQPASVEEMDERYLVTYGNSAYKVNVRYIDTLSKPVVAVRRDLGQDDDNDGRWTELDIPGAEEENLPEGEVQSFESPAGERAAAQIGARIAARPELCGKTHSLSLQANDDGSLDSMYRDKHSAWVFFAECKPNGA